VRQPEIIVKKVRHSTLEAIKAGKGILAQRQQDIHRQVPCAQDPAKLGGQPFFTAIRGVVQEVLLELVEDQVDRRDPGLAQHLAKPKGAEFGCTGCFFHCVFFHCVGANHV
jgi:hypothetical protein